MSQSCMGYATETTLCPGAKDCDLCSSCWRLRKGIKIEGDVFCSPPATDKRKCRAYKKKE